MNLNTMNENDLEKLKWVTPEHPFWSKDGDWYVSVIIIGTALVIASVIFKNLILAIFIVIATITLLLLATVPPKNISVILTKKGVVIGPHVYPYANLESFWVEELEQPPRLLLKSKKLLSPLIMIEIIEVEEEKIRNFLNRYIEEEELHEPLFHRILERLGF